MTGGNGSSHNWKRLCDSEDSSGVDRPGLSAQPRLCPDVCPATSLRLPLRGIVTHLLRWAAGNWAVRRVLTHSARPLISTQDRWQNPSPCRAHRPAFYMQHSVRSSSQSWVAHWYCSQLGMTDSRVGEKMSRPKLHIRKARESGFKPIGAMECSSQICTSRKAFLKLKVALID